MSKSKMSVRNNRGQILVEALVISTFMFIILIAFQKMIENKKNQKDLYYKTNQSLSELNNNSYRSTNELAK